MIINTLLAALANNGPFMANWEVRPWKGWRPHAGRVLGAGV